MRITIFFTSSAPRSAPPSNAAIASFIAASASFEFGFPFPFETPPPCPFPFPCPCPFPVHPSSTTSGSSGSISIVAGSVIARSISRDVPAVSVADRSAVHRAAPLVRRFRSAKIAFRSSSNPRSNSRSASSNTSHRRRSAFIASVCRRWSNSLPGVATRRHTPFLSRAFSFCLFSPPTTPPHTTQWYGLDSVAAVSNTCAASSRVGVITNARIPSALAIRGVSLPSAASSGHKYASVFPDPVSARTSTSSPRQRCGITRCCTRVGAANPAAGERRCAAKSAGRPTPSHVRAAEDAPPPAPKTRLVASAESGAEEDANDAGFFALAPPSAASPSPSATGRIARRMSDAQSEGLNPPPSIPSSSSSSSPSPSIAATS
eukprot:1474-Pelagococcus_subviridis.AAC.1